MILVEEFPMLSAASMYWRLRMLSTDPRTILAVVGAMMIPIAIQTNRNDFVL
jgi:hypothetical protein